MKLTLPVAWHRQTFAVHLLRHPAHALQDHAELVSGLVGGPFGIFCGSAYSVGPPEVGAREYTLVHLPSQIAKLTLPRRGLCRQAAEEFATCDLAWESAWPPGVTGSPSELEKSREIYRRWKSFGVRKSWGER